MPTREQAETYSAVLHYLRAVAATGTTDADRVIARMKSTEVNDFYAAGATLRADGRLTHTVYGARVKSPAETKYSWHYYQLTEQIPGQLAFRPLAEGGCSFVSND